MFAPESTAVYNQSLMTISVPIKTMGDLAHSMPTFLSARSRRKLDMTGHRRAAVLTPFIQRPEGWHILFIQRSSSLSKHGGQIAFPAGAVEPDDENVSITATRETEEENGTPRDNYIWTYGPHTIWGFTSRMLKGLPDAHSTDSDEANAQHQC